MNRSKSALWAAAVAILSIISRPGWCQNSSQVFAANPRAHYQAVKQILDVLIEQEAQKSKRELDREMAELSRTDPAEWRRLQAQRRQWERTANLYTCATGSDFLTDERAEEIPLLMPMARVAQDTIDLTRILQKFPRQIWEEAVRNFEAQALEAVLAQRGLPQDYNDRRMNMLKWLEPRLNAAARSNPGLPRVTAEGGCGAGEIIVSIETDPLGGQVLFIPTFFYEFCKTLHMNPDDIGSCNHWREALSGTVTSVSGDYFYQVRWPDGATRRGKLSISPGQDGSTIRLGKR